MVTRPLDLESRLRPEPRSLDALFYVNVCILAVFFLLMGSRFVLAPGLPLELPEVAGAGDMAQPADIVVSMRSDDLVLFEGGLFPLAAIGPRLEAVFRERQGRTLLVRVHREVAVQALLNLCSTARSAGAERVLVAAEEPRPAGGGT